MSKPAGFVHCPRHGQQALSRKAYREQLSRADAPWTCPFCGAEATWDDEASEALDL